MILVTIYSLMIAPISVMAEQRETNEIPEDRKNIIAAVKDLNEIMNRSYENTKQKVKELVKDGYDYELTMESMEIQGTPYADFDYEGFLAAYATIKAHSSTDIGEGINQIDFVRFSYKEESTREYLPVRKNYYKEIIDGVYEKSGYYFLTEPCEVGIYELMEDGYYRRTGSEYVELETTITRFANVMLSMVTLDQVYETFDLKRETYLREEKKRLASIKNIMGESKLIQYALVEVPLPEGSAEYETVAKGISLTENPIRKLFLTVAASLIGKIPYEWGGKADHAGFDPTWYTLQESGKQKGLDCSGFTQWVMWTAGYSEWDSFGWTGDYLDNDLLEAISWEDLQPGDFGLFYPDTEKINHIGIYAGNGYWIHCSSGKNTVTVSNNMKFAVFRRLKGIDLAENVLSYDLIAKDTYFDKNEEYLYYQAFLPIFEQLQESVIPVGIPPEF